MQYMETGVDKITILLRKAPNVAWCQLLNMIFGNKVVLMM